MIFLSRQYSSEVQHTYCYFLLYRFVGQFGSIMALNVASSLSSPCIHNIRSHLMFPSSLNNRFVPLPFSQDCYYLTVFELHLGRISMQGVLYPFLVSIPSF